MNYKKKWANIVHFLGGKNMKEYTETFKEKLLKNIKKEEQQIELLITQYEAQGIDEYGKDFKSIYLKHLYDKLNFIQNINDKELIIGKQNIEECFKDNDIKHLFMNTYRNYNFAQIFEFSCGLPNKIYVCDKKQIENFIANAENIMII